jgi:hypothetical protein
MKTKRNKQLVQRVEINCEIKREGLYLDFLNAKPALIVLFEEGRHFVVS